MHRENLRRAEWGAVLLSQAVWAGYALYSVWNERCEHKAAMKALDDKNSVISVRPQPGEALLASFLAYADEQIEHGKFHSWSLTKRQFIDHQALEHSITMEEMNKLTRYVSDMSIEDDRVVDKVEEVLNTTQARVVIDAYKSGDRSITATVGKLGEMVRQAVGLHVLSVPADA